MSVADALDALAKAQAAYAHLGSDLEDLPVDNATLNRLLAEFQALIGHVNTAVAILRNEP